MNELVVATGLRCGRLKSLVLDSVSSRSRGEFTISAWTSSLPGTAGTAGSRFHESDRHAWRVALEARGLGPISLMSGSQLSERLAVEAADNGLLAPELASGIARSGRPVAWRSRSGTGYRFARAQTLLNAPVCARRRTARSGHVRNAPRVRTSTVGTGEPDDEARPAAGQPLVHSRISSQHDELGRSRCRLGEERDRCMTSEVRDRGAPIRPVNRGDQIVGVR